MIDVKEQSDKRSVFTDALETLGNIIDDTQKRDAIHLAVEPIVAKSRLYPGQDVAVDGSPTGKLVGIVDPFLKEPVNPGERFWLVIYPRQIKSLRHVWSHPDFPETDCAVEQEQAVNYDLIVEESKKWIEEFISRINESSDGNEWLYYDELMKGANAYLDSLKNKFRDYLNLGELLEGVRVPEEFWVHFEVITGRKKPEEANGQFFTCSC